MCSSDLTYDARRRTCDVSNVLFQSQQLLPAWVAGESAIFRRMLGGARFSRRVWDELLVLFPLPAPLGRPTPSRAHRRPGPLGDAELRSRELGSCGAEKLRAGVHRHGELEGCGAADLGSYVSDIKGVRAEPSSAQSSHDSPDTVYYSVSTLPDRKTDV